MKPLSRFAWLEPGLPAATRRHLRAAHYLHVMRTWHAVAAAANSAAQKATGYDPDEATTGIAAAWGDLASALDAAYDLISRHADQVPVRERFPTEVEIEECPEVFRVVYYGLAPTEES